MYMCITSKVIHMYKIDNYNIHMTLFAKMSACAHTIDPARTRLTPAYLRGIVSNLISNPNHAYEWLMMKTVDRNYLRRTVQDVQQLVAKCGMCEVKTNWVQMDDSDLLLLITELIIGTDKETLLQYKSKQTKSPLEQFVLDLNTFIHNFIPECLLPPVVVMSIDNIYDIINKLIYNRESGYKFLMNETVDINRNTYSRSDVETILANFGFDDYVYNYMFLRKDVDIRVIGYAVDSTTIYSFDQGTNESINICINSLYRFARLFLNNFLVFVK
jgi:hypothetical protein